MTSPPSASPSAAALPAAGASADRRAVQRAGGGGTVVPALVAAAGEAAAWRYVEFFAANIRNPNTRRAYARACGDFLGWCERRFFPPDAAPAAADAAPAAADAAGRLAAIRPFDVAAYIEALQGRLTAPSVKQQLAAIRMLFDWLVTGQIVPQNPAAAVRGPKHVVHVGKTPVLEAAEWRRLMDAIPGPDSPGVTLRDLRDRALIATLTYSFARIGAALALRVEDLRPQGAAWVLRLHEKGGKHHVVPCHHALADALHAYLAAARLHPSGAAGKQPLFRTARGRAGASGGRLAERAMTQVDAWRMIRRRALAAGIATPVGCHSFRATGITAYLANGGALEHAQALAAHESPRTTKLYDRTRERLTRDEVERIRF